MTEETLREKLQSSFKDVDPIVKEMTHLIMDAYQKGFLSGMEIGQNIINK